MAWNAFIQVTIRPDVMLGAMAPQPPLGSS